MTKVCGIVRRDAARIHEDSFTWGERNDLAARRVVQPHGHRNQAFARGSLLIPVSFGATRVL